MTKHYAITELEQFFFLFDFYFFLKKIFPSLLHILHANPPQIKDEKFSPKLSQDKA
jgi:hypothetical protein